MGIHVSTPLGRNDCKLRWWFNFVLIQRQLLQCQTALYTSVHIFGQQYSLLKVTYIRRSPAWTAVVEWGRNVTWWHAMIVWRHTSTRRLLVNVSLRVRSLQNWSTTWLFSQGVQCCYNICLRLLHSKVHRELVASFRLSQNKSALECCGWLSRVFSVHAWWLLLLGYIHWCRNHLSHLREVAIVHQHVGVCHKPYRLCLRRILYTESESCKIADGIS